MKKYQFRELVSFKGKCAFNCKHCFAYEIEKEENNSIQEIVNSLENKRFDIIYISHNKENLLNIEDGINLCSKLYNKYNKDICVITRQVINDDNNLQQLKEINSIMNENNNNLYFCISIPALYSYDFMEDKNNVPTPIQRIMFMKKLKELNINTILTIRPLFPNKFVNNQEICDLLSISKDYIDAVTTGGLIVTDTILKRLNISKNELNLAKNNESDYLVGAIKDNAMFVNVNDELKNLELMCNNNNIPFFMHSMDALNYLNQKIETTKISNQNI